MEREGKEQEPCIGDSDDCRMGCAKWKEAAPHWEVADRKLCLLLREQEEGKGQYYGNWGGLSTEDGFVDYSKDLGFYSVIPERWQ